MFGFLKEKLKSAVKLFSKKVEEEADDEVVKEEVKPISKKKETTQSKPTPTPVVNKPIPKKEEPKKEIIKPVEIKKELKPSTQTKTPTTKEIPVVKETPVSKAKEMPSTKGKDAPSQKPTSVIKEVPKIKEQIKQEPKKLNVPTPKISEDKHKTKGEIKKELHHQKEKLIIKEKQILDEEKELENQPEEISDYDKELKAAEKEEIEKELEYEKSQEEEKTKKVEKIISKVEHQQHEEKRHGFFDFFKRKKYTEEVIEESKIEEVEEQKIKTKVIEKEETKQVELNEEITEEETKVETKNEEIKEEESEETTEEEPEHKGFFAKLKETFTKKLSDEKFEELFWDIELALLENNASIEVVEKIKMDLKKDIVGKAISKSDIVPTILKSLKASISSLFDVPKIELLKNIDAKNKEKLPYIISFIGVNGSGKTTQLAKVANYLKKHKKTCVIASCDTFRAAAIQQLEQHANNLEIKMIKHNYGADAAAVAFDAIEHAKAKGINVVLIDTAGRLHSNENLMQELKKLMKVSKPDLNIFVGESITGNDCVEQAKQFGEFVNIDGIILTKADVDDKGGAAISISYVTGKPIMFFGNGQSYDDLKEFDKEIILESLDL
jgi:fused signal recognition particle receptor